MVLTRAAVDLHLHRHCGLIDGIRWHTTWARVITITFICAKILGVRIIPEMRLTQLFHHIQIAVPMIDLVMELIVVALRIQIDVTHTDANAAIGHHAIGE